VAQTPKECFAAAEKLRTEGRYADAADLYQRVAFFSHDSLHYKSLLGSADCYLALKDYPSALNYYSDALIAAHNMQHDDITFSIIQCQLYLRQYKQATESLQSLDTTNENTLKRYLFYTGTLKFLENDFHSSEQCFDRLAGNDAHKKQQLDSIFRRNARIERIHPGLAFGCSLVLPGSGQILYGNWKEGANSLGLTIVFGALMYNTAVNYGAFTAITGITPWYIQYYRGGALNAKTLALQKKANKRAAVYQGLLKVFYAAN
jgi:tetratricopeptide (TPR) repeat protein